MERNALLPGSSPVAILCSSAVLTVMCNTRAPLGCAVDVDGWVFFLT